MRRRTSRPSASSSTRRERPRRRYYTNLVNRLSHSYSTRSGRRSGPEAESWTVRATEGVPAFGSRSTISRWAATSVSPDSRRSARYRVHCRLDYPAAWSSRSAHHDASLQLPAPPVQMSLAYSARDDQPPCERAAWTSWPTRSTWRPPPSDSICPAPASGRKAQKSAAQPERARGVGAVTSRARRRSSAGLLQKKVDHLKICLQ